VRSVQGEVLNGFRRVRAGGGWEWLDLFIAMLTVKRQDAKVAAELS
jgi:hypothetical protein